MKLEEAIKILSSYEKKIVYEITDKDKKAVKTILNYIKEESISKAEVRDMQMLIEFDLQQEYKEFEDNATWFALQQLLNKGEQVIC